MMGEPEGILEFGRIRRK